MRLVLALAWHSPPERSRPERQQLRLDLVLERRPARHAFGDCLVDRYSIRAQAIRLSPSMLPSAPPPWAKSSLSRRGDRSGLPHRNGLAVAVLKGNLVRAVRRFHPRRPASFLRSRSGLVCTTDGKPLTVGAKDRGPERRKTERNCHEWVVVTDPFHQRLEIRGAAPLDDEDANPCWGLFSWSWRRRAGRELPHPCECRRVQRWSFDHCRSRQCAS